MSDEETDTLGGSGEVSMPPTATVEASEEIGVEEGPGGGATLDATNTDADVTGAGGRHRAEKREMEWVAVQKENPASKSSGVGDREGVPETSGVAENPQGGCQGVGRGVKLPRGTDTHGVEELPRGNETSGVTLKGNGVPGMDGRGQGGNGNSSDSRDAKGNTTTSYREEMASRQDPAAAPSAMWGTAEVGRGEISQVSTQRHSNGSRPKHHALACQKYYLLATERTTGNPAPQGPRGAETTPRIPQGQGTPTKWIRGQGNGTG